MNERDTRNQEYDEQWGRHPHRHHGGRRFRARFGPPGSDPAAGEAGGPGSPRMRGRADFGGRGDFGPRGFGPADFGPGAAGMHGGPPGFGPRGRHGRRGGRAKRGDVRAAALALLAEEPMNGYQIIQQISERSGGLWRPSPGSVYPALAQLEDENLVVLRATAGERRAYALTDAGREYVAGHADELKAPWSAVSGDAANAAADMRALVRQVHIAAFGVVSAGTESQLAQARKILAQTRRSLYRILAEDEDAEDTRADEAPGRD
ncbi:MAG: PadR family transcriptional regulator [Streptosporangiaceae bacterium]